MRPVEPILTAELFPGLHAELMGVLEGLSAEDWGRRATPRWTVKDVAAHLLDVDVRRLSSQRDGFRGAFAKAPPAGYAGLVEYINRLNNTWVEVWGAASPRVLVSFLALTGPEVARLFASLDPLAPAPVSVAWAGEDESANWFDVARELTERWHHQQQIRDAVGAPPLYARRWLHPVLDTFLRGLPHAYRDAPAPEGARVLFDVTGEAGGLWTLARERGSWALYAGGPDAPPSARVRMSEDAAWRLLTKGLTAEEAARRVELEGEPDLGAPVLRMLSVMA